MSFLHTTSVRARVTSRFFLGLAALSLAVTVMLSAVEPAVVIKRDQPWQLVSFAEDAGLGRRYIYGLEFEADGTVWVAATDGLRRYDGYRWTLFTAADGLASSFVRSVCRAKDGALWVGTDKGAGVFDPIRKTFDRRGSERGLAGPGVRRICQDPDPDGTLWFCCDRWPDVQQPGGLSSLHHGVWKTYTIKDGLPADHVLNYLCDSSGRRFASTIHGVAQWDGSRWQPLRQPGYLPQEQTWLIVEGPDQKLFAQGSTIRVLENNQWQELKARGSAMCMTREGELVSTQVDLEARLIWFTIWNGKEFVRASAASPVHMDGFVEMIRQAPDGSIWCVGYGQLLRWNYRVSEWTLYDGLPAPRLLDGQNRTWFASGTHVVVEKDGGFQSLAGLCAPLFLDSRGDVWSAPREGLVQVTETGPVVHPYEKTSLRIVEGHQVDAQGVSWFYGRTATGDQALASFDGTNWESLSLPATVNRRIISAAADSERGLWLILAVADINDYAMAYVDRHQVTPITLGANQPRVINPRLCADKNWIWMYGFTGLYRAPRTEPTHWSKVDALPHRGFIAHAAGADYLAFLCNEAKDGGAVLAIYQQERWRQFRADFSEFMYRVRDGTVLVAERAAFHIWDRNGSAEIGRVHLPAGELVKTVVQGGDGSYWIGTVTNVLHYQPARELPRTLIMPSETNVPCNGVLSVAFRGVRPFSSINQPASYQFSWRFDKESWLPFQGVSNCVLSVARLKPGVHRLDVRARDAAGKADPRGQGFYFTVLSVPMQDRRWFLSMVAGMALLLMFLGSREFLRLRQLAQTNEQLQHEIQSRIRTQAVLQETRDELELRVEERTAELSQSITSLTQQIAERQRAESATAKLEAQLRQAQKMEAIGTLAGGIAHDFNNILAVILPSAHLALKEAGSHPMLQKSLTRIVNSAERARSLVKQILTFSRLRQPEWQTVNLESLVKESMKLLRAALPSTIEIVVDCQPNLPTVLADPTQIHQVIMNLCSNAEHAMRGRVGRLDIRLESFTATESASASLDFVPGSYVKLSVSDTGHGMDAATLKRIFDPFFTTKTPQEGTGLGLAVVHGIVQDHGGAIHVRSEVGHGSIFDFYIPTQAGSPPEVALPAQEVPQGRGERILFVDDEIGVCETAQAMLEQYGYKVTTFTNPLEAVAAFQSVPDSFDLVFTDLTMPGITGVDLALNILEIRRHIPVILATGFGGAWKAETARRLGIHDVVLKPISPESYGLIVHHALHPDAKN